MPPLRGLAHNPSLEAAQASLCQSNENLRAGYGIFYPQLSADLNPVRQKFSPARFGSSAPANIFNLNTLSALVSYSLDIFGGEHRAIENLQSRGDFQRPMVLATYLALSGNIVSSTIAMAAYSEEIKYTEQLIALQRADRDRREAGGGMRISKVWPCTGRPYWVPLPKWRIA